MQKKLILPLLILFLILQWCMFKENNFLNNTDQQTDQTENINNIENSQNTDNIENVDDVKNVENTSDSTETAQYENKIENFSLDFPKNWTVKENTFNVTISTPKDDEINENVIIVTQQLQKFLSVAEYYEETIRQLKETLENFKETKSKDITQWELKGKTIIYEHIHKDTNLTLKSLQTFFMAPENRVYSINYTATKDSFDKYIEWVETIINSFKLNK